MTTPITEQRVKDYYEQFTESHVFHDRLIYNRRYIHIHQLIKKFIQEGMEVLELGCGTGITSEKILKRGARVTGVDLSENNIRFAKAVVKSADFIVQDVLTLDLNKKFDVITLFDFMEHIPKEHQDRLFEVIRRHVHPKTTIIINIPNARSTADFRRTQPELLQVVDEEVTLEDFVSLCRRHGFYIQRYITHNIFREEDYDELIIKVAGPRSNAAVYEGKIHFIFRKIWWLFKTPLLKKVYHHKLNTANQA